MKSLNVLCSTNPLELLFVPATARSLLPLIIERSRFVKLGEMTVRQLSAHLSQSEIAASSTAVSFLSVRQVVDAFDSSYFVAQIESVGVEDGSIQSHGATPFDIDALGERALHYIAVLKMLE